LVQLAAVEGQQELEKKESVDLGKLVKEEIEGLASVIENRSLEIKSVGLDAAGEIDGDPLMLRIAVRNVLSNAFDFSPRGGLVEIRVSREGSEKIFSVLDEGPGLPDYAVDRVFDRFYSLKNEVTGRKGSGIGLSFVKATMELHGGEAVLRNREAGGAEAVFRFSV
jgi:two-component system sensor histidine kinase CreC